VVIRPATEADIPAVLPVFEAAKAIMRADGNHEQWGAPGFPGDALLLRDIARGGGFVIESVIPSVAKESIVAYFALLPSPEPTYDVIDGAWLTDEPYGVIHRIASSPEVHGVFSAIIDFAAARYPHLRIDTHRDNRIMQHLIDAAGFRIAASSGWKTAPSASPTSAKAPL
jgi:hypothetical protein